MDHDHMDPMSPPMAPMAMTKKRYTSMTFFWSNKAEVLFTGWPGDRAGMYALALIIVFLLAVVTEIASSHRVDRAIASGGRSLTQTAVHVLRVGLMYLLMLAVMSFNGGIFLAACVGHAAGFLLFRSNIFGGGRQQTQPDEAVAAADGNCCNGSAGNGAKISDLPAMSC